MIIHDLVRLGKAFAKAEQDPVEIIQLVTSVTDQNAAGFYRHVFIVEILQAGGQFRCYAHPYVDWTNRRVEGKKERYVQQEDRACVAPIILPSGGNPRSPQGIYAVPAYIVYHNDFIRFPEDTAALNQFLQGRLDRTIGAEMGPEQLEVVAAALSPRFAECDTTGKEKMLGIVLLCLLDSESSPYELLGTGETPSDGQLPVTESVLCPGHTIVAGLSVMLPRIWHAKSMEGSEQGILDGTEGSCSFCGRQTSVVSSYCKAWPWMTVTWEAPLPEPLEKNLVEAIALCEECYKYLTLGAKRVTSYTTTMQTWLTRELFSPAVSASGKEQSPRKTETVYGSAYILPLTDTPFEDPCFIEDFVAGYEAVRRGGKGSAQLHLDRLTGLELYLPLELGDDLFRLTILYFTGNLSRADIHLRGVIEDVVPSAARTLGEVLAESGEYAVELRAHLEYETDEAESTRIRSRFSSLPYLLANAYGIGYVWQALARALHRQSLSQQQAERTVMARINEVSHRLARQKWALRQEVLFYLAFKFFIGRYTERVMGRKEDGTMRTWQELQEHVATAPLDELHLDDVEELGFACGQLVGDFSRRYYQATRQTGGKDYLQTRVMTFGSSITPEVVVNRAMLKFQDYGMRVGMKMHMHRDLLARTGVVLNHYARMIDMVKNDRDRFMLGFWSAYSLATARKTARPKQEEAETAINE